MRTFTTAVILALAISGQAFGHPCVSACKAEGESGMCYSVCDEGGTATCEDGERAGEKWITDATCTCSAIED